MSVGVNWRRAPDSALPTNDPHGRAWASLSAEELKQRAAWCMREDSHEALRRARMDAIVPANLEHEDEDCTCIRCRHPLSEHVEPFDACPDW